MIDNSGFKLKHVVKEVNIWAKVPLNASILVSIYNLNFIGVGWWVGCVDAFQRKESGYPLRDFASLKPDSWSSSLPGIREGSYGQFNPSTT